ncbi:hypothetical protein U472_12105 [Orenia metallireducens]|uniref:Glycosidase n=1 Tax=Orenia metallireducens TaxID=1413210 RepID=A0A1C0A921_9FIRM|nr:carbohydrate binding domain-containing protein [Orenia metallireducens]OCL26710.1 hypothetical protein U472_12105 [Orenia metallireducens]
MKRVLDKRCLFLALSVMVLLTTLMVFTEGASAANTATIYYKRGYATPYIHYRPEGGSWTSAPGVAMSESEFAGYSVYTIDLGSATRAEVCFNDGNGNWDSNGGSNYWFDQGISTYANGIINSGEPQVITNQATIYYKRGYTTPYIHYRPVGGIWTTAPGVAMLDSEYDGYSVYTINLGSATQAEVCFNDGNGNWDSNGSLNYFFNQGDSIFDSGTITAGKPVELGDTTPPTITPSLVAQRYENPISITFDVSDNEDPAPRLYYTTNGSQPQEIDSELYYGETIDINESMTINTLAIDASGNRTEVRFRYYIGEGVDTGVDFREETIYFVMTTRFYDGDSSNNEYCWADESAGNVANNDPAWRGDFKGLAEKLDYIKALGFSAVWITPVVKNASGYDYHGYHAVDFTEVDPRYESDDFTYQDLIDAVHAKGMKIIQDVVFNHSSNFGEENLYPLFKKDANGNYIGLDNPDTLVANSRLENAAQTYQGGDYSSITSNQQYGARIAAMKEDSEDTEHIYHHEKSLQWEGYTVQTGQIAGDCVDLNTENPEVANYLINAYNRYIDMGVDGFRVDTVKHISRLTFNKYFNPAFKARGGDDFFMFGEVAARYRQIWNSGIPAISVPFYTWKESASYPWGDKATNKASVEQHWADNSSVNNEPTSDNAFLAGNNYHQPDWSMRSGLDQIDFPMHWNFNNAYDSFGVALSGDQYYNDATWNVTYVDSHDYAPDGAPENQRFAGSQETWAENLSLMFTFRGIPTIYYGSEIEFQKGMPIDVGPNAPLAETGRAYFGDRIEGSITVDGFGEYSNATGTIADTLNYPLAQHIRSLNLIRRAVPALQKGQYSTADISGNYLAFKRRYTDEAVDSFALVTVSGTATFYNVPNGTYVDAVTGDTINVTNNTLTAECSGKGNLRVYVLNGFGKVADYGSYLN